ncbi:MAG TPA: hypothetical protein VNO55_27370 [Polyangia bacterium]|nr:hypothetical protein [Polyangia bacterium]
MHSSSVRARRLLAAAALFLLGGVTGCLPPEVPSDSAITSPGTADYPVDETGVVSGLVATCSGSPGQWAGCRGHGCLVCGETTQLFPYYFVNHPKCDRNLTCDGQFSACNDSCPTPTNADKEPAPGQCNGTSGQWAGCRGNGCAVCSEKLTDYPFYFQRHPRCVRNDACAGTGFATCNASCPQPTDADKTPLAGTCSGTAGQWAGCRGNGCQVCAEKLGAFPNYFKNHPNCVKNNSCAGVFAACNSNCPAPTDADRAAPVPACDGSAGQWAGCRGTGCLVCSETTRAYPYYFVNHPGCVKNLTCDGSFFTCNASCPAPVEADKRPAPGQCIGTPGQWNACRGDGCSVCSESLTNHPFYFHHHPSCHRNDLCGGQQFTCNDSCPAPTDKEKSPPAGTCNGTSGQWAGCRGNGCSVCAEKLTAFPSYFKNHPDCVKNTTCAGVFAACNSNCPAPTDADRATGPRDPNARPPSATCPWTGELAVSADNVWDVYVDGLRVKPTDTTNVETDWRRPAKYALSLKAGPHVIAVHAADSAGGRSGFIGNLSLFGMPAGGGLTEANSDWQVLAAHETPPADWTTAAGLPWVAPPVATDACQAFWGQDAAFAANWKKLVGSLSPKAWVWNRACDSMQPGWQKNNWFRLVVNATCDAGSTTCPEGTACPLRDANGNTADIGICKAGACQVMACDELSVAVDAVGNPILPPSVRDLADGIDPLPPVDMDTGPVSSPVDRGDPAGGCQAVVGDGNLPDSLKVDLNSTIDRLQKGDISFMDTGLNLTAADLSTVSRNLADPAQPFLKKIRDLAATPNPAWNTVIKAAAADSTYVEQQECQIHPDNKDPFGGRDIIFVHGYDPDVLIGQAAPLFAKTDDATHAEETWPDNRDSFYSGYFKRKADKYWQGHIERYLTGPGHRNRYLTVAWSTNQRLDVGVDALLTQVSDAMKHGTGVVKTWDDDPRGVKGFCVPGCIIMSHSTGAPVTDVAMVVAHYHPELRFIPDHMKAHVSFEGAYSGSPIAPLAISLVSGFGTAGIGKDLAAFVLRTFGIKTITPGQIALMPDFTKGVTLDLVPSVAQSLWGPYLDRMPVPTLTVTGGSPLSQAQGVPVLNQAMNALLPGFQDDTLTSNSTCAIRNPVWAGPSGYVASFLPLFGVYDLGIPTSRAVGYYLDQALDPNFGAQTAPIPFYRSAGCIPELSPDGMVQPVGFRPGGDLDPHHRYHNHFSFLQTAANHSLTTIAESAPDYQSFEGARQYEESRVIDDELVYTLRGNDLRSQGGTDTTPIVDSRMKTLQNERHKGLGFTISFHVFGKRISKRFWIWKRRYQNLKDFNTKDQADYVYENVSTTPPPVLGSLLLCTLGN